MIPYFRFTRKGENEKILKKFFYGFYVRQHAAIFTPVSGRQISIVGNYSILERMAFRKLRLKLGEQRFRECLIEGIDILAHSQSIKNPGGWLYSYMRAEAEA